ncbi:hypothetical protein EA472_13410 [Natrarchaeobius oligotrophus]|uniref:Uncharacterized protein n=1 Tax=Natrarchaeobius chitinivorans TaxID=1679083 RepID=A0A3N6MPW6_NATCH|nr:hypothetical protein EA472_13410 [Natrarchaeobius chitinivorans]
MTIVVAEAVRSPLSLERPAVVLWLLFRNRDCDDGHDSDTVAMTVTDSDTVETFVARETGYGRDQLPVIRD